MEQIQASHKRVILYQTLSIRPYMVMLEIYTTNFTNQFLQIDVFLITKKKKKFITFINLLFY